LWSTGATTSSITITGQATYTVTVTGNCGTAEDSVTIGIDLLPVAIFNSSATLLIVSFIDSSTNATGWAWDFGDGSPIDNNQNALHTYAVAGTYVVCLTVTNNCGQSTTCDTITVSDGSGLGIDESANIGGLLIYPNPTRNLLNLEFVLLNEQDVAVRLISALGQLIYHEYLIGFNGVYKHTFDLSMYARGVYTLQIFTTIGAVNEKIIIE